MFEITLLILIRYCQIRKCNRLPPPGAASKEKKQNMMNEFIRRIRRRRRKVAVGGRRCVRVRVDAMANFEGVKNVRNALENAATRPWARADVTSKKTQNIARNSSFILLRGRRWQCCCCGVWVLLLLLPPSGQQDSPRTANQKRSNCVRKCSRQALGGPELT